jgi:hypothetical protein
MDDKSLLRLALATGILGVVSLFLIMHLVNFPENSIGSIKSGEEDDKVKITGRVERQRVSGNTSIITISREEEIKVIIFEPVNLEVGKELTVIGRTKDYLGEMEILADEVTVKN